MFVCYAHVADNYKEIPDLLRTRIRTTSDGGMGSEQIDDLLKVFAVWNEGSGPLEYYMTSFQVVSPLSI